MDNLPPLPKLNLHDIAENVISSLEQMSLPVTAHGERLVMVNHTRSLLEIQLTEAGYVRLVKPDER